jgi:hypothetical protein
MISIEDTYKEVNMYRKSGQSNENLSS